MMTEMNFHFDYERPNTKSSGLRTPVKIYLQATKKTGGILYISNQFLQSNGLNGKEIAIQVKGKLDTYIIFNPPKNAPRFQARVTTAIKNATSYSCTEVIRKILTLFCPGKTMHEMWLESVGTFGQMDVYRLRNLTENDALRNF